MHRCFHRIGAGRRGKEISSNRPGSVCFSPFVLPLALVLPIYRGETSRRFFSPFYLRFSPTLRWSPDFPLSSIRSSRPAASRYYPVAISLARPAFFRKPSRSRPDGAIVQMLTRRRSPSTIARARARVQVRTYICYICNRKLQLTDEINRSRRLLRKVACLICTFRSRAPSFPPPIDLRRRSLLSRGKIMAPAIGALGTGI